jgi:tRNA-2-methylthio-N6-dimethylallyladenosine synthase
MRKIEYIDLPSLEAGKRRNKETPKISYDFSPKDELLAQLKGKKFLIRTYGCQANIRDEEIMSGILTSLGLTETNVKEDADITILNTCAVRENAEDKVYGEIGEYKALREKNKNSILLVCGCMVEQRHIIDFLCSTFPHVDIMFGTHNTQDLGKLLSLYLENNGKKRIVDVSSKSGEIYENLPSKRQNDFKAFVNISYGCNKFCTYCIVPYTRGKERSRDPEDILKECKSLVDAGYQEITLLGQNVDSYGKDRTDGYTFAHLLEEVAKLGMPRLRFLTSYPSDFKDDVIDVIAKYPNIMKFIHLPVQSGSDEILHLMNRRYTTGQYLELVNKIREKIPHMAFSTDIIVGFPNETYEQFLDTIKLVKEVGYTSAFTFIYSPRKGTPAANMVDNVTYEEKVKRFQELLAALEVSVKDHADEMVGKVYEVLVDGPSKKNANVLSGTTENMKTVIFEGDKSLIGKIVKLKIDESHVYSMHGVLLDNELDLLIADLKKEVINEPIVQEYLRLKNIVDNSEELHKLEMEIKFIKKCEMSNEEIAEYNSLLKKYNENPIIINYLAVQKEMQQFLKELKDEFDK